MDPSHVSLIKLLIAYTILGAFIFTVLATCLSLVGIVKFRDKAQQKKLFYVLIVEIVTIGVGFFGDILKYDPGSVIKESVDKFVRETKGITSIQLPKESTYEIKQKAKELQDYLQKKNYIVPDVDMGGNARDFPANSEIRFFHSEQLAQAKQLKVDLENFGLKDFYTKHISGYADKSPHNLFEIWFKDPRILRKH